MADIKLFILALPFKTELWEFGKVFDKSLVAQHHCRQQNQPTHRPLPNIGNMHTRIHKVSLRGTLPNPGAVNNAISVGVMLECMRVLVKTSEWSPKHTIIFHSSLLNLFIGHIFIKSL